MTGERTMTPAAPSLGSFLVAAQVIDPEQLASALRQQVIFGGRLGTNMLELGYAEHDQIALALAKLHGVPAALMRHLRGADPRARTLLPPARCIELEALPLAFATAGGRKLVVCMRDADDADRIGAISLETRMQIVAAACPERTLFRLLAQLCGAPLPARMSAPSSELATPFPAGSSGTLEASAVRNPGELPAEAPMPALALVDLDHSAALRDPTQVSGARLSLAELADQLRQKRASAPPEPIPLPAPSPVRRRRAATSLTEALLMAVDENELEDFLTEPVPAGPPPMELDAALAAIGDASQRSQVSDAVIAYLKSQFDAAVILVVRDQVAYGYRGFGGHFDDASVESILVPLNTTSPFQVAHRDRVRYVGAGGGDARSLFGRFLRLFPITRRPELCLIEPVEVRDRVVCLIYAHSMREETLDDDAFDDVGTLADAVGEAFLRLIRAQRRA